MERILNSDDILMVADRLENSSAAVSFMAAAVECLCERDQSLSAVEHFGMSLVFGWITADIDVTRSFIVGERKEKKEVA